MLIIPIATSGLLMFLSMAQTAAESWVVNFKNSPISIEGGKRGSFKLANESEKMIVTCTLGCVRMQSEKLIEVQ